MKLKNFRRALSLSLCALVMFAGCGSGSGDKTSDKDAEQVAEYDSKSKADIKWINILHTASAPTGPIEEEIEKYTNANIEFQWIPDASNEEKMTASLASENLGDIVTLTKLTNSSIRNALKAGQFWEVEEYLDQFPNLKDISKEYIEGAKIGGKLYGIPFQKELARYGVIIRKDWLDNLGLKEPSTTEELLEIAKAFTENDPDGNGVKDTVGVVERNESFALGFRLIASYNGAPDRWYVTDDGEIDSAYYTDEYVEAMDFFKTLYENGWMNQDFAVMAKQDQQKYFAEGKAGIYLGGLFDGTNFMNLSKGIQDNMELSLINDIVVEGKDRAVFSDTNGGIGGLLAFPKSEVKDEAELLRILQFVDQLMDEDMYKLMTNGIKDVHYTEDENGVPTITDTTAWQQEVQPFAASRPSEVKWTLPSSDEYRNISTKLQKDNAQYVVLDPTRVLESETYNNEFGVLEQYVKDAYYKYVHGEISKDDIQTYIDDWTNAGGKKMIEEFTASYKEINNK